MSDEKSWRVLSLPGLRPAALRVEATRRGVCSVELWPELPRQMRRRVAPGSIVASEGGPRCPVLDLATDELARYFDGHRVRFETPLDSSAWNSDLDREVVRELRRIEPGETISYGELAQRIGRPRAARPVGQAVGRNPVPVIVPCHRVIGARGHLTGFSFGLSFKVKLLELEGVEISRAAEDSRRKVLS